MSYSTVWKRLASHNIRRRLVEAQMRRSMEYQAAQHQQQQHQQQQQQQQRQRSSKRNHQQPQTMTSTDPSELAAQHREAVYWQNLGIRTQRLTWWLSFRKGISFKILCVESPVSTPTPAPGLTETSTTPRTYSHHCRLCSTGLSTDHIDHHLLLDCHRMQPFINEVLSRFDEYCMTELNELYRTWTSLERRSQILFLLGYAWVWPTGELRSEIMSKIYVNGVEWWMEMWEQVSDLVESLEMNHQQYHEQFGQLVSVFSDNNSHALSEQQQQQLQPMQVDAPVGTGIATNEKTRTTSAAPVASFAMAFLNKN